MRDTMVHRGPDEAGLWRCPWAAFGHRRLAVIAPGPEGRQPMTTAGGRYTLVYNGELYNDAELREELQQAGAEFHSRSDSETVLTALAVWGAGAMDRLRGMFALAFLDRDERTVLLARDPLGIKPLYVARLASGAGSQVVFASEPAAVLAHPDMSVRPDWVTVSAYMTTIRPTLGSRTMFDGLETLLPGESRLYRADEDRGYTVRHSVVSAHGPADADSAAARDVLVDSVRRHMRTDVPMCALLSGGLDSAAVVSVAIEQLGSLRTYCAGARLEGFDDDFHHASGLAGLLGTAHTEVEITLESFAAGWAEIVARTGMPLSTPNEVAIHAVARALRQDGHVVALTGEGADELFGGYEPPMRQAAAHIESLGGRPDTDGGLFHLRSNAWVDAVIKPRLMRDSAWARVDRDAMLGDEYQRAFREVRDGGPRDSPLQAHLRFHRRMNLPNLLRRLDTATMLACVEGRTPFADIAVARYAERLPMQDKFTLREGACGTKLAVRRAFTGVLPASIVERPKASFPLPFQAWAGVHAGVLRGSRFGHELFNREAVETVSSAPEALWNLAWPMINLAMWGERWWGCGAVEYKGGTRQHPVIAAG